MASSGKAAVASLRTHLRADCSAFRRLTKCERNDFLQEEMRVLDVATLYLRDKYGFGQETPHDMQRHCELLGLFGILARLDAQAWRDQVVKTWDDLELDADEALRRNKPFVFGLELKASDTSMLLELATTEQTVSSVCKEILKLAAAAPGYDAKKATVQVPIRMVLDFRYAESAREKRLTDELQAILYVHNTMKTQAASEDSSSPQGFRIQEVLIDYKFRLTATEETLEIMKKLVACGIRVHDLPCIPKLDRVGLLQTLQQLIPPREAPSPNPGITTLVVSDSSSNESIPAILSALSTSSSVRRVDLQYAGDYSGETREEFWRWVAYAVFSRDAIHNVEHFHLDPRCILSEDIELMRQVLEAEDPLAALLGEDRDAATDNVWLSASHFMYAAPSDNAPEDQQEEVTSGFTSNHPLLVPVVKRVPGGWSVLLPAYGKAWVRDEDAHVVPQPRRASTVLYQKWKVSSKLVPRRPEYGMESIEGTIALLKLIGHRVDCMEFMRTSLSAASFDQERDGWLQDILSACPQLRDLKISQVEIGSLSAFVDTPAAHRIRKLVVNGTIDVTNDLDNVTRFFEALSDPSHPLARHLYYLELSVELNDGPCGGFINMVRSTWERSTNLQTMVIRVSRHDDAEEVESRIERAFFKLQNQSRKKSITLPPSAETKMAFLSVVPIVPKGKALDSSILSTIFDFAAIVRKRDFWFVME